MFQLPRSAQARHLAGADKSNLKLMNSVQSLLCIILPKVLLLSAAEVLKLSMCRTPNQLVKICVQQ